MRLKAEHIVFSYTPKSPRILNGMDFEVAEGETVGLLGPSGCGKSTLAQILCGQLEPLEGEVTWGGKPLPKKGYCPVQLIYQHPERAINPRWYLEQTMNEAWNPPEELQEKMGIEEAWKHRYPYEVSGGEMQRFCVIRALSPRTRILICDEMTTMLDPITQAQIWGTIVKLARERNMGLVVITHNKYLADHLCDRYVTFAGEEI